MSWYVAEMVLIHYVHGVSFIIVEFVKKLNAVALVRYHIIRYIIILNRLQPSLVPA